MAYNNINLDIPVLVGQRVFHKAYGNGQIDQAYLTEQAEIYIKISFDNERETNPFSLIKCINKGLIVLDNPSFDVEMLNEIAMAKKQLMEEIESQKSQTLGTADHENDATVKGAKQIPPKKKQKMVERSNIAFKCNFCDGGKSDSCVGFKGVCSDTMIRYNIETAHHVWCASESQCSKYLAGTINRQQLDESSFFCYEGEMLTEWKASAGVVQNGARKGTPMKLLKVQNNSLAVLTTKDPYTDEASRYVFAVFLVDESYEGDGRNEGYVTTNSKWKLELTPTEARKVLFWDYYFCPNAPTTPVFGSGLHRYLSDVQSAQILRNISGIIDDKERAEFAAEFYAHYCQIVGLNKDSIDEPSGTLKRI